MSDALREIAATFGIEWDDGELRQGMASLQGGIGLVQQFATVLAGSALVQGIRNFASGFEQQAGAIEDTAGSLGLATTELQELNYAAEQGGVGAQQMSAALATLQRNAIAARAGTGPAASAFRALGIQLRDSSGATRSAGDIMDDLAANMSRIEDPARRTALAQQVLGESGRRLLTVLHDGEGGLAQWRAELAQLGGGLSPESIAAAGAYGDAVNRWRVAGDGVRAQLATALLPLLTRLVTWVSRAAAAFSRLTRGTQVVRLAMVALGAVAVRAGLRVAAAWLPAAAPVLAMAAAVALAILIVDDIYTLFTGGDSLIGRWLDSMLGAGEAAHAVRYIQEAWEGVRLAAHNARLAVDAALDAMGRSALGRAWRWATGATTPLSTSTSASAESAREARWRASQREAGKRGGTGQEGKTVVAPGARAEARARVAAAKAAPGAVSDKVTVAVPARGGAPVTQNRVEVRPTINFYGVPADQGAAANDTANAVINQLNEATARTLDQAHPTPRRGG